MSGLECMCDPDQDEYQTAYDIDSDACPYTTAEYEEPPRRKCQCASRRAPQQTGRGGMGSNVEMVECPTLTQRPPERRPCRCAQRESEEGAGKPCRCAPKVEGVQIPQKIAAKYGNQIQRRAPKVRPRGQATQVNIPATVACKYFPKADTPSRGQQVEIYRAHDQGEYYVPCPAGRGSPNASSMSRSPDIGRPRATSTPIYGSDNELPADRSFSPSRFEPQAKCQGCCQRGCCQ